MIQDSAPTVTVPDPPAGPNVVLEPERLSWQRALVGAVTSVEVELPHAVSRRESVTAAATGRA